MQQIAMGRTAIQIRYRVRCFTTSAPRDRYAAGSDRRVRTQIRIPAVLTFTIQRLAFAESLQANDPCRQVQVARSVRWS